MTASNDWIEQRLETVLARAADTVQVPEPPGLAEAAPGGRRRPRHTVRRWAVVSGTVVVLVSGGSIAAATLVQPHVYLDPLRSRISPTSPAISQAVAATMPPGGHIVSSQEVTSENASYDDTTITTPTATYVFTVYQRFSSAELDGFGLKRRRLPGGTEWYGGGSSTQASVYYLSNIGIGVYVRENSSSAQPVQTRTVETLAQRLADEVAADSKGVVRP